MSPKAYRRSAEGDIQKKIQSILTLTEGGYIDSLLLAGYVCSLLMTLSFGNFSRRRVSYFEILKFQINLQTPWHTKHKIAHHTCRSKLCCAYVDLIFLTHSTDL